MREAQRNHIKFSLILVLLVWTVWFSVLGPDAAFSVIANNWRISVTMIFGSLLAGGTAEGGGAVAFPVLTKLLHVHPTDAKVFALAIQSIGMISASAVIIFMNIRVEWRAILYGLLGGIPGVLAGTAMLSPLIAPDIKRMSFTMMQASFALTLIALNKAEDARHERINPFGIREKILLAASGLAGGVLTGLVGTGIDIVVFSLIVLLFRISEKIATPTTVVLQAATVIAGFLYHAFAANDISPVVRGFWLSAIPVVVVGAPIGAMICTKLSRAVIVRILLYMIAIEVITSFLIIPLRPVLVITSAAGFVFFLTIYYGMFRNQTYRNGLSRSADEESAA